jgi:hypothetical protein
MNVVFPERVVGIDQKRLRTGNMLGAHIVMILAGSFVAPGEPYQKRPLKRFSC